MSAAQTIALYRQAINRIHARHVKVIMATISPFRRYKYWTPAIERERRTINRWLLSNHLADGAIDFSKVLADPADPRVLRPSYDSGDGPHSNDHGHAAMARAIDLSLFTS